MESGSYSRVGGLHFHESGLNNSGRRSNTKPQMHVNYNTFVLPQYYFLIIHCHCLPDNRQYKIIVITPFEIVCTQYAYYII